MPPLPLPGKTNGLHAPLGNAINAPTINNSTGTAPSLTTTKEHNPALLNISRLAGNTTNPGNGTGPIKLPTEPTGGGLETPTQHEPPPPPQPQGSCDTGDCGQPSCATGDSGCGPEPFPVPDPQTQPDNEPPPPPPPGNGDTGNGGTGDTGNGDTGGGGGSHCALDPTSCPPTEAK